MKKLKILLTVVISTLMVMMNVNAKTSYEMTVDKEEVKKGETFTVTLDLKEVAAWAVRVTAEGPASEECEINEADVTAEADNTNKTFTATCTATGEGEITLTLSGDITNEDEETTLTNAEKTVTVSGVAEDKGNPKTGAYLNTTLLVGGAAIVIGAAIYIKKKKIMI